MPLDWADLLAKEWMSVIKQIYQYKGIDQNPIAHQIVVIQGKQFSQTIDAIFQGIDYHSPDYYAREVLKKNTWLFSIAKNYHEMQKINNLLLNDKGEIRSWSSFKKEAKKVVGDSIRYLQTEHNTVVGAAQMSRVYNDITNTSAVFPYIQFEVINDGKTSDVCKPLHGVIVHHTDPMLQYFFPPNHFNCRTTVRKLRNATPTKHYTQPQIPEAFKNNPAITGKIFTEKNTFIANTPKNIQQLAEGYYLKETLKQQRKEIKQWAKEHLINKTATHPNLDKKIQFSVTGIKEALNQPHKHIIEKK